MFYKFAPRRSARFSQVWIAALAATLFLELGQIVFAWYLGAFTNFNALYGVFGTIMGLLLWIYFSGVILLLGACVAATIHRPENAGWLRQEPGVAEWDCGLSTWLAIDSTTGDCLLNDCNSRIPEILDQWG